jgi:hypothetical protein
LRGVPEGGDVANGQFVKLLRVFDAYDSPEGKG